MRLLLLPWYRYRSTGRYYMYCYYYCTTYRL